MTAARLRLPPSPLSLQAHRGLAHAPSKELQREAMASAQRAFLYGTLFAFLGVGTLVAGGALALGVSDLDGFQKKMRVLVPAAVRRVASAFGADLPPAQPDPRIGADALPTPGFDAEAAERAEILANVAAEEAAREKERLAGLGRKTPKEKLWAKMGWEDKSKD